MNRPLLVVASALSLLVACVVNPAADPCGGECSAHAYTPCTCAPTDPCRYRSDGVCDDACYAIGANPLDDSRDCTPAPLGPCGGECSAHAYTPCTCAPTDPCRYRGDGVCDDACYAIGANPLDDGADCAPVGPCGGECGAHAYTPCTCAPDDPCGYRNNGVCDDACYAVGANPLDDAAECGPILVDEDLDGIADDEELALAQTFAPILQFAAGEAFSEHFPSWLVEPTPGGVSLFYALSYYEDGGDVATGAYGHLGDPEFIVVDVVDAPGGWQVASVFLSAYYRQPAGDLSGWYPPEAFVYDTGDGGVHPFVSVAANEHAMFPNAATCDASARMPAACDDLGAAVQVAAGADGNLGNPAYPLWDAVDLEFDGLLYTEWYFTEVRFCGWWVLEGSPRGDCALDGYAGLIADWLMGL